MLRLLKFYSTKNTPGKFSHFIQSKSILKEYGDHDTAIHYCAQEREPIIKIIAYCIMPTHIHLLVQQIEDKGIETYMGRILNAYTRYYNSKTNRIGPLWQGRYKNVHIETNELLLHINRYIHLNPVTSYLCDKPKDWFASSYNEYINLTNQKFCLCTYNDLIDISQDKYIEFVDNQIDYQRSLSLLKKYTLE